MINYDVVGATIVDPDARTSEVRTLRVRKGRFDGQSRASVREVSGAGLYVLPGLIEMHAHVIPTLVGSRDIADEVLDEARSTLVHARHRGVTTFRDLGGPLAELLALRGSLSEGPRLLIAGPVLTAPGGHGMHSGHGIAASTPANATAIVEALRSAGVDHIKIVTSGARGQNPIDVDTFDAIVRVAASCELSVAVHSHFQQDWLRRSAESQVASIEHGFMLHLAPRTVDLMASNSVALCPTLRVIESIREDSGWYGQVLIPKAWNDALDSVATVHRAGVTLVAGTDFGVYGVEASDVWREMALISDATGSPWEGIRSATTNAATVLRRPDLGTFAHSALADFVVLAQDPLLSMPSADDVVATSFEGNLHMATGRAAL